MVISESPVAIGEEEAQLWLRLGEPTDGDDAERVSESQIETGFPRRQCHARPFCHDSVKQRCRRPRTAASCPAISRSDAGSHTRARSGCILVRAEESIPQGKIGPPG